MQILRAVVIDLSEFAISSVREWWVSDAATSLLIPPHPARTHTLMTPQLPKTGAITVSAEVVDTRTTEIVSAHSAAKEVDDEPVEEPASFRSIKEVVIERTAPAATENPEVIPSARLVVAVDQLPMYTRPTREFDTVLHTLPYGVTVTPTRSQGVWTEVRYLEWVGWVHREALVTEVAQVRPYFILKEYCPADAENTVRLRQLIDDVFSGARTEVPLQAEEYAYYRLFTRGVVPPEVQERPRRAGNWQRIYKGRPGVHVGVRPKTGSIMEYVDSDDIGRLAYVEAVFPDESISLAEVGYPHAGYYNERVLQQAEWHVLQPVFIQFS